MGKVIIDFKENAVEWRIEGKGKKEIIKTVENVLELLKSKRDTEISTTARKVKKRIKEPNNFELTNPKIFLKLIKSLDKDVYSKLYDCIAYPSLMTIDYADMEIIIKDAKKFKSAVVKANSVKDMCKQLKKNSELKKAKGVIAVFEIQPEITLHEVLDVSKALHTENTAIGAIVKEDIEGINAYLAIAV